MHGVFRIDQAHRQRRVRCKPGRRCRSCGSPILEGQGHRVARFGLRCEGCERREEWSVRREVIT